MWKVLLIVYVAVAVILATALLYLFCSSWKELSEEEKYMEYPEGAGAGLSAISFFFVVTILAAVLWPFLPLILIGVWAYWKIAEKYPELFRIGEGDVNESEGDC